MLLLLLLCISNRTHHDHVALNHLALYHLLLPNNNRCPRSRIFVCVCVFGRLTAQRSSQNKKDTEDTGINRTSRQSIHTLQRKLDVGFISCYNSLTLGSDVIHHSTPGTWLLNAGRAPRPTSTSHFQRPVSSFSKLPYPTTTFPSQASLQERSTMCGDKRNAECFNLVQRHEVQTY
jgi:hypothetical protein